MKEQDLYLPVKILFESMDYSVYGEVNSVDVIAKHGPLLVAIELKKEFSLHLIAQGAQRHKLTDFVYIAIPKPTSKVIRGSIFKDKLFLLKRLGIGLILIDTKKSPYTASIYQEPSLIDIKATQTKNKKKRTAVLKEIKERHGDYCIGGTRGKIVTAYREQSLQILHGLRDGLPHTCKEIREFTHNKKATNIMYKNHYHWYKNIEKGVYQISDLGKSALVEYDPIIKDLT